MAHHPTSRARTFRFGRRLFLLAVVLIATGASLPLAQVGFTGRRALLTGNLPQAVAAADLNGDGKLDLVTANGASNDVSIFLGVGGGMFRPQVKKAAGSFPSDVVLGAGLCFGGTNAGKSCAVAGDCPSGGTCKIGFNTGNATRTCVGGTNPGAPCTSGAQCNSMVCAPLCTGDNLADMAVTNYVDNSFQIFLGDGVGGFGLPTTFSTDTGSLGKNPTAMVQMDWNLDGRRDLAIVLRGTNNFRLYNGDGCGGFSLAATYSVGLNPDGIVVGDWDSDGNLDAAVSNEGDSTVPVPGSVSIFYHSVTGFFLQSTKTLSQVFPKAITAGLLNFDSLPDLVISGTGTDVLTILYGDDVNGFTTESFLNVGGDQSAAVVSTLNGDANNDLAVVVQPLLGQTQVKVFTGDGFGTFTTAGSSGVGGIPPDLLARDLGDAAPIDLVSVDTSSQSISLLFGSGTGTFTTTPAFLVNPTSRPSSLTSADLNGDGILDIGYLRTETVPEKVILLTGTGTGTFGGTCSGGFTPGVACTGALECRGRCTVTNALCNRDVDCAGVNTCTNPVPGTCAWQQLSLPGNVTSPAGSAAILADQFTSDNNRDLAILNNGLDTVSVFSGNGAGVFTGPTNYGLGGTGITGEDFAAGPLNDTDTTHPDLVVANSGGDTSFPNGSISVFLQSGGGFGAATRYNAGTAPTSVAVGTINADTARDLVVSDFVTNAFSYLAGNGTGTFPTVTSSAPVGNSPRKTILRDLDGDGDLDLVVINPGGSSASVFLGNNAGGFAPVGICSGGPTPGIYCTAAADCGAGGTCPAKEFFAGVEPYRGTLADVNQDGWLDLVTNNRSGSTVAVLEGDGMGHFGVPALFGVGGTPTDLTLGDFNGDGKPDVATSDQVDGRMSILLNASQSPLLTVTQPVAGTLVSWSPLPEAEHYDVIRGDLSQVNFSGAQINLGTVVCIEDRSPDTSTTGNEDTVNPAVGGIFFYAFRNGDSQVKGSYGRSTDLRVRVVTSGNCL